jgi:hypothetical protein
VPCAVSLHALGQVLHVSKFEFSVEQRIQRLKRQTTTAEIRQQQATAEGNKQVCEQQQSGVLVGKHDRNLNTDS